MTFRQSPNRYELSVMVGAVFKCTLAIRTVCIDFGLVDGNNVDNLEMFWNIDKIFGMMEGLIATNKRTKHFY